jgi:hypothetical protein
MSENMNAVVAATTAPAADGSINTVRDGAPAAPTIVQPNAAAQAAWFPDEQKDYVANKAWKDPKDVLNSYINLEKLVGADKAGRTVLLPKDEADVEAMKAFREKIGVPADVKGYAIPEILNGDPIIGPALESALKHGIPAKSMSAFLNDVMGIAEANNAKVNAEAQTASQQQVDALKRELGPDRFNENVNLAQRAFKTFAEKAGWTPEELSAQEGMWGSAKLIKLFASVGETLKEDQFHTGDQRSTFTMSKMQAEQALTETRAKRAANQMTQSEWQAESERLMRIIHGTK